MATSLLANGIPAVAQDPARVPLPSHPKELRFVEQELDFPSPDAYCHQLANGLVVYLVEDPALPLVDVRLAMRAGGYLDPPAQAGLAYLTSALMRRGGTHSLAPDEVDERIDLLGARLDAVGQVTHSGLALSAPSWVLEEALDLFWEVALEPRFDALQLDHVKAQLRSAMAHRHDDPRRLAEQEWARLLFGETSAVARDLTPSTLDAIDRDDLLAFHRRVWRPANMVLAVSGAVDRAALLADLEERWRDRASVDGVATKPISWPPRIAADAVAPGLYIRDFTSSQTQVILGHRLPQAAAWRRGEEHAALLVLEEILGGGGAIARLAGRLRSGEALTYEVRTELAVGPATPDSFRVSFAVANANVARALLLIREELERLRREAVSENELRTARREVLEPLRQAFDSAEEVAGRFAEDHLLARPPECWQPLAGAVGGGDAERTKRLAASLLAPDQWIILLVGPWRDIQAGAKKSKIDLRRFAGHRVVPLAERDPWTLEPLGR